jgi:hypothetical protein
MTTPTSFGWIFEGDAASDHIAELLASVRSFSDEYAWAQIKWSVFCVPEDFHHLPQAYRLCATLVTDDDGAIMRR